MSGIPYPPPTEILPIFDDSVFQSGNDPLTYNVASTHFLKYPTAQGTETFKNASSSKSVQVSTTGVVVADPLITTPNRPLVSFMNNGGNPEGYLSVISRNLAPTTLDPFSWYFKISDSVDKSYLELGGAFEDPSDDPAYYNNRIKHNEILMVSDKVGQGGLLRLVYNPLSGGSGLYHADTGSGGFTIEEAQGNLDIKTIGGYDITLQSSNQVNLNSNDNVNINAGVNILASNTDNGITRFDTKNGNFSSGDVNNNYNKTSFLVDDFAQDIYISTPNGRIWNGDNNGIGTGARTRFDVSKRVLSVQCGHQSACDEVGNTIGTKIEEYCNFISTDVDVQMKEVGVYFNDLTPNGEGWYCYIMNYGGGDIQVTSNDGKQFISRTIGGFNPNGIIGKFTTVRLTLVYLSPFGDYFWSLMSGF